MTDGCYIMLKFLMAWKVTFEKTGYVPAKQGAMAEGIDVPLEPVIAGQDKIPPVLIRFVEFGYFLVEVLGMMFEVASGFDFQCDLFPSLIGEGDVWVDAVHARWSCT